MAINYSGFVDELMDCATDACYLAIIMNEYGYDIEVEFNANEIAGTWATGTHDLLVARGIADEIEYELAKRGVGVLQDRESWEEYLNLISEANQYR